MIIDPAEAKLRRARSMLILGDGDEPFFGSVALGLDLIPNKACQTAATDGKRIIYNPEWIETLDAEETMALFEHEVYHVALKHGRLHREIFEEPNYDNSLWQRACDIPINAMLMDKNRKLPATPDGRRPQPEPEFDGMSAMRIYRMLQEEKEKKETPKDGDCDTGDDDGSGETGKKGGEACKEKGKTKVPSKKTLEDLLADTGGFGGILPLMDEKTEELAPQEEVNEAEEDFEQNVANSARVLQKQLESSIGDLPGFVKEIIEAHTKPQRTYKDDILDIMEEITRDDYCWARPNKKYDVYLPSLYSKELAELVVIVDSSGSVSQNELEIYAGEISGILEEFEGIKIHVIFHHTTVYNVETYEVDNLPVEFGNIRSGGTNYRDAYARIDKEGFDPRVVLHFTDLDVWHGAYPPKEPDYPVVWMNTTPRLASGKLRYSTPPWGRVVDLDPDI